MQGFDDITLTWDGVEYTVPSDNVLLLVARIEDILRGPSGESAVSQLLRAGGPGHAVVSMAFAAALRHAGADVSDQQVYLKLHSDLSEGQTDFVARMQGIVLGLLAIVSPPAYSKVAGMSATEKKQKADQATD